MTVNLFLGSIRQLGLFTIELELQAPNHRVNAFKVFDYTILSNSLITSIRIIHDLEALDSLEHLTAVYSLDYALECSVKFLASRQDSSLFLSILADILKVAQQNGQKEIQHDQVERYVDQDKEYYGDEALRAIVLVHDLIPVVTDEDDEDCSQALVQCVKVDPRRL